jgi:GTP1/Obg family GTP-binding protein
MPPINAILNDMEKRIMHSIRQLGEKLLDVDAGSNHCRYGTEEREELLEEVATRVDDELTDLRIQSTDVIEEVKDEVDRMLNQVDDDAKERIELLESELEGRMKHIAEEAAEKYVKDTLLNASWRMDGTMSLQRQM